MRLSTLFLLFSFSLLAGCGSNSDEPTTSSPIASGKPKQDAANEVSIIDQEFYRPTAFVDDSANDRWLIADKMQGIIAINKTTDARTIIAPLSDDETGLQSASDIALDSATNTLYVLDRTAKNIVALNTENNATIATLDSDIFDDLADARWGVPTSLFFDDANQRLLIGDSTGLEIENSNGDIAYAFCVFIYTPANNNLSIMAEMDSRENPRFAIFDIYYDADNERLLTSGLRYSTTGTPSYAVQSIPVNDWAAASYLFAKSGSSISNTAKHSITYDKVKTAAYIIDSDASTIYGFDLSTTDPVLTLITEGDDGKAYPFQSPSAINFSEDYGLQLLDESSQALLSVADVELLQASTDGGTTENTDTPAEDITTAIEEDTDQTESDTSLTSADRTLILSGIPLPDTPATSLQFPDSLLIEPSTQKVVITDRARQQPNAIESGLQNGYSEWEFNINLDGITPDERNFNPDNEAPSAPSITEPFPQLLTKNSQGDVFVYAKAFLMATDDDFTHHLYNAAIYQRLAGETDFTPISTFTEKDNGTEKTYIQNIQAFASGFRISQGVYGQILDIRDIEVVNNGIIIDVEVYYSDGSKNAYLTYWRLSDGLFTVITSRDTSFNPRNVTGMAISPDESTLYFTDAIHDSLISITLNSLDATPSFSFNVVSGRQHDGDYIALPAGLALNKALTKAWTFDNAIKAVVEIDLNTGFRTRLNSSVNYIDAVKSLELSEDETTLFLIDKTLNRVISIDLLTDGYPQNWLTPNN